MSLDLPAKVAAFCRELAEPDLEEIAAENDAAPVFARAKAALAEGRVDAALEEDLDALEAIVRDGPDGEGFYPLKTLAYNELPGASAKTGAQKWTCPHGMCDGRGRVKPNTAAPVCAGTGVPLVATPVEP